MSTSATPDALYDSPEYWLSTLGPAQPKFTSLPIPGASNELAQADKVARILGLELKPWQRFFIRVVSEKNPDGTYRFSSALLTCPRQSGKSVVLTVLAATRALGTEKINIFYTAQTNKNAYEQVILNLAPTVQTSVIGSTVTVRRSNTSPGIRFNNGSSIQPFTPTPEGLHGATDGKTVFIDEIFTLSQSSGDLLLGASVPVMLRLGARAQLVMISTKGTIDSEFMNKKVEKGQQIAADPTSKFAFFEWSLPDDRDPMDISLDNYEFHPGIHAGLIDEAGLQLMASELSEGELKRTMANILTTELNTALDIKKWDALQGTLSTPAASQVAYGFEASQSSSAIVAAWKDSAGLVNVKLIRADPGTQWLSEALTTLKTTSPLAIGSDRYAENNVHTDNLMAAFPHMDLKTLSAPEFGTASVALKAHIEDGTIRHDGSPALHHAVKYATTRSFGDAGWAFSHNSPVELMAMLTAVRLVDQTRVRPAPAVYHAD